MSRDQTPPPVPKFDAETARRFLSYILDTEAGVCEIRIFRAWLDRSGYIVPSTRISSVVAGWYDSIHEMIVDLGKLRGVSAYITINPVISDLFARCANKLRDAKNTTNDGNIVAFRWLYIDIDPKRPADISSTDAELAAAVEVRDRILDDHPALAQSAIWGKSGNGAWILVLLPDYLPEKGHDLATQALGWIAATYSDEAVKIDVSTKNPSRVGCIPGTVKCKGDHVPDRPHRLATLDSPDHDADNPLLPCDLRAWIESVGADQVQAAQPARVRQARGANGHANGDGDHLPARKPRGDERADRVYRAEQYLKTKDLAISGQGGHTQAWKVARDLRIGFGLTFDEAWPLFTDYSKRCDPPWNPQEEMHKVEDAGNKPPSPGYPMDYLYKTELSGPGNGHLDTSSNGNGHAAAIPTSGGKKSPVVYVTHQELLVNDHVGEFLHTHDGLYQRNYRLVEVASSEKDRRQIHVGLVPSGTPTIMPVAQSRLREIISSVVTFKSGVKDVHPPDWCVSALLNRQRWPGVPVLHGIVEHPILRPDGSIAEKPGYDRRTGILCVSDDEFLPVPPEPTHDDAIVAAQRLLAIVGEFPFHRDADAAEDAISSHKAAWLACLLTILCRHLIDDAVPLFLVEATAAGTGKTLLCDLINRIATGRDMIRSAYYHDAIEMDKQIVATALGGIRVTMLDNVSGAFGNSSLDNALTGRWYRGRILGQSTMTPPLLLDTVFVATGNNLSFHGDLFRRIVPCRLESPYERPDKDKTDFAIPDIRKHVRENRAELLRDAFTICRAYIQAGCPHSLPTNVYGEWTRLVRGAIVWTLDVDPMDGQADLAEADVSRSARAALIEGFAEMLLYLGKSKMTSGEILAALQDRQYDDRFPSLREGMSGLWSHGLPSIGSLGKRLMNMRNARVGSYRLVKAGMNRRAAEWTLQQLDKDSGEWGTLRSVESDDDSHDDMDEPHISEPNIADLADF